MILASFKNDENGIEARVAKNVNGFAVSILDSDSGETFSSIVIYPTIEAAIASAKRAAA